MVQSMKTLTNIPAPDGTKFTPYSEAYAENPYTQHAALRALPDPYYFKDFDGWIFSRYHDIRALATSPQMVRSTEPFMSDEERAAEQRRKDWHDMPNHERLIQVNLLDSDGPDHMRLRKLVFGMFTNAYVERHRDMIQSYANKLLTPLFEQETFDFTNDLAVHIPGHIIGNVLGVPDEDCPQLRTWSEDVVQFFDFNRSAEDKARAERATSEFDDYLKDLIKTRRKAPKEDLLSTLIEAHDAGKLNETELVATAMLILMAGHGSTIDVMGSGLHALLTHPDQHEKLRQNPEHLPTAIQEMFRYDTPLPFFHRYAAADVELCGYHIPKGTKIGLLYASGNHDPAAFEHPDSFDITRTPNRHLSFGQGAHLCLGNNLSRLDMEILFETLLRRTKSIEIAGPAPFKKGLTIRGPETLPISVRPA